MGLRQLFAVTGVGRLLWSIVSLQLMLVQSLAVHAESGEKIPILFDTDIGTDVDDAFALGLILASPEIDLRGVTTAGAQAMDRAWIVCRFLTHVNRGTIPVAYGREPQSDESINWQIQYRRHPAVVWNRTVRPRKESAVEFLYQQLKAEPGKLTIVAVGPLTNIARLLRENPDAKPWIKRIVCMAGSVRVGYSGRKPPEVEWNVRCDRAAAQTVFRSGVPLLVAPLDATTILKLDKPRRDRLFAACTPLTYQLQTLYQLWEQETPTLYDPVAVALTIDERFCDVEQLHLTVDDKGMTRVGDGKPNARVATSVRRDAFLDWYTERTAGYGKSILPDPPKNESALVKRSGLPNRVHVFEDYDTDIEKRWWMTGKLETKDLPHGGRRACRSVLTQDYDGKMGNTDTAYAAVVFNPVPGPPMGRKPRLSFRYKLHGTDRLRVQLFSLSNGYHRYLSVKNLPQNQWQSATVDMTQMRRPDGTGGPLSEDERIDDIQFYVDPRAEVLIDDVVLYDAAPPEETRAFPKRFLFTGWFDTGKQGNEWPGEFEIALHEKPRTWDFARSVIHAETGRPWLRIHMRGQRRLEELVRLRFRYRITGGESIQLKLVNSQTKAAYQASASELVTGEWNETSVDFRIPDKGVDLFADEIHLVADKGEELQIDDLLLYVPGTPR